jgi:hypothetical protein
MNTPAHLIFAAAAFARPGKPAVCWAAVLGGLAPDISLYTMVGWSIFVLGIPARVVFDELYFSDGWQAVFAVDNSLPFWGIALALGVWRRWPVLVAFAGAGVLHLAFDLPLHNEDARRHFWPISDWVFRSPLSYWDPRHFGQFVAPVEVAACIALAVVLWRRFVGWQARALIAAVLVLESAPAVMFALMFSGAQ